ncbi:5039_t:CDS:2, partial [Entrophospora sp. SA101]
FKRCHRILDELPGSDLSREEQEQLLKEEKAILEERKCHRILDELPGSDLSREEQEQLLKEEKAILEERNSFTRVHARTYISISNYTKKLLIELLHLYSNKNWILKHYIISSDCFEFCIVKTPKVWLVGDQVCCIGVFGELGFVE